MQMSGFWSVWFLLLASAREWPEKAELSSPGPGTLVGTILVLGEH